jgi:hypothetical protein
VKVGNISRRFAKVGLGPAKLEQSFETPEGPVHTLAVPGAEAVAAWTKLRAAVGSTKHWPVLLGPRDAVAKLEQSFEGAETDPASKILEQAGKLPGPSELLARRRAPGHAYPSSAWPEGAKPFSEWSIPKDGEAAHKEVLFGLLPTETSWHVPALLRFGGWKECPLPKEHVALLKHWNEKFGAEVAGMTRDTLELQVARPPQDRDAALALAKEHYDYCNEVVGDGVGSVEALAARLLGGSVWCFWWD